MKWLRSAWAWISGKKSTATPLPPPPPAPLQLEDGTDLLEEDGLTPIDLEH